MSIVYTPHVCDTPRKYDHRNYDSRPAYPFGTLWQCDDCDRYWKFRRFGVDLAEWKLVQSWHLVSVFRILRADAQGPRWVVAK